MFTVVKNQLKVCFLSVKYNIMKEMLNKVTFVTNVLFMILNNATFIVQWVILFSLKDDIGGYSFKEVMVLWGVAASTYGLSHILFARAFSLPDLIINGKLDSFLVQPKNVLLGVITSSSSTSAIGDLIYGYALILITSATQGAMVLIKNVLLFSFFTITGTVILTSFAVIMGSLSFYLVRADILGNNFISMLTSFATYPDGIFKGAVKFILTFIIPVGMAQYIPVHVITKFSLTAMLVVTGYAFAGMALSVLVFYRGLKRYSSSNLFEMRA